MADCAACLEDHGFCVYCSRQFTVGGLHRHIAAKHGDTIRRLNCADK